MDQRQKMHNMIILDGSFNISSNMKQTRTILVVIKQNLENAKYNGKSERSDLFNYEIEQNYSDNK